MSHPEPHPLTDADIAEIASATPIVFSPAFQHAVQARMMSEVHGGMLSPHTCASLASMLEIKDADDPGCLDT